MNFDLSTVPTAALVAISVAAVIQIALTVIALIVLVRTPRERVALGMKWPWVLIILLINLVGAIVFLAVGRKPAPVEITPVEGNASDRVSRTVRSLYGDGEGNVGGSA